MTVADIKVGQVWVRKEPRDDPYDKIVIEHIQPHRWDPLIWGLNMVGRPIVVFLDELDERYTLVGP